jgi:hypothetical protein
MGDVVDRDCLGELFRTAIIEGPERPFCERVFGATVINQSGVDSDVKIRELLTVDVIIREPLTVDSGQSRCKRCQNRWQLREAVDHQSRYNRSLFLFLLLFRTRCLGCRLEISHCYTAQKSTEVDIQKKVETTINLDSENTNAQIWI